MTECLLQIYQLKTQNFLYTKISSVKFGKETECKRITTRVVRLKWNPKIKDKILHDCGKIQSHYYLSFWFQFLTIRLTEFTRVLIELFTNFNVCSCANLTVIA